MSTINWDEVLLQAQKMGLWRFAARLGREMGVPRSKAGIRRKRLPHRLQEAVRVFVLEMYGRRCLKCGSTESLQIDHIFPRFRGGDDALDNLQVLCWPCNKEKNHKVAVDYRLACWQD